MVVMSDSMGLITLEALNLPQPPVHPDREAIMAELHARPVDIIEDTTRVRRVVFVVPPGEGAMEAIIGRFRLYGAGAGIGEPPRDVRQFSFSTGTRAVTWEFHTEFVTITWRTSLSDKENWPGDLGLPALGDATLIAATGIDVLADQTVPARLLPQFILSSLCVSTIEDGVGEVVTDFTTDADGFTRFEFAAGALTPLRRSVLTRRLLEVDTYRSMVLLALPLARRNAPALAAVETELTRVIETLPSATTTSEIQAVLVALHDLSVRSGQLSERLGYRFAAARAYGDILRARLLALREGPTPAGSSIGRYLGNRVDPALGTCAAMEKRLTSLSGKIERAIGLLNVRIGLDLQIQNQSVLETIASTSRRQFRLQRTVEGLSVIAVSYYALGVMGYLLGGPLEYLAIDKALALSFAAPFAVLSVWLFIRAIQRSHVKGH
jgi:uncharacterized membrane-anchored protein